MLRREGAREGTIGVTSMGDSLVDGGGPGPEQAPCHHAFHAATGGHARW